MLMDLSRRKSESITGRIDVGFLTHLINIYRVEQYKKQLKKWNWSKYLPAKEAFWMGKAAKRKREEKKDTIFNYCGQTYTKQSLQQRLQRKKNRLEETIFSAGRIDPCLTLSSA